MEISSVKLNGDVTFPKPILEALHLKTGDKVVFWEEDGKVVITKDELGLQAFNKFADDLSQAAEEKGITEEIALAHLEKVREQLWNEQYNK